MAKRAAETDESPSAKRNKENVDENAESENVERKESPSSKPSPGIIKSVYVENFMCHRKMQVDLCRNVNFIHGQNGSGKSAILAALQICLGAGARRTHRARNLKELIRNDGTAVSCARVRVTLVNSAEDGYRYDTYGDTITVERTIANGSGFNGYKLLDANLKEQSRDRKDLNDLLDVLNIQVENPVAVLDQEEAKKFLGGKNTDKYAFFNKATELERVDRVYATTIERITELDNAREKIDGTLHNSREAVRELEEKYREHQLINKLRQKEASTMADYGWALYQEQQQELTEFIDDLAQFKTKCDRREKELADLEAALAEPEVANKAQAERLAKLTKDSADLQAEKAKLSAALKHVMKPQKDRIRQVTSAEREAQRAQQALESARTTLQKERDAIVAQAGNAQTLAAERTEALGKAEEDIKVRRDANKPLQQNISEAKKAYEELEPLVHDARATVQRVSGQLRGVQEKLQQLESSSGSSLAVFGRRVPDLVNLIGKTKQFQGPVLGPVGQYISVVPGKEDFVKLAQQALGQNNMDRFVVTCTADRILLNKLRRKVGCGQDCGVFQVAPGRRRYSVPSPPEGVETVATVLQIKEDLVFNALVDQARIEAKALCRGKEESERKLQTRDSSGQLCIRGAINEVYFLPKGDKWTCRKGMVSMISNDRRDVNVMIGVDKTRAIRQARGEEAGLQEELSKVKQDEAKREQEHHVHQRQWSSGKRKLQENNKRIEDLEEEIQRLRDEIETTTDTTVDLKGYEENVTEAEKKLDAVVKRHESLKEEVEQASPKIEERRAQHKECAERIQEVMAELEKAQDEMTQFIESQTQRETEIKRKRDKVVALRTRYEKGVEEREEKVEKSGKLLIKARNLAYTYQSMTKNNPLDVDGDPPAAEPAEHQSIDPTPEELEQIEIKTVKDSSDRYRARIEKTRDKIAAEQERRQMSNEDAVTAYQKYIRAKKALQGKIEQLDQINERTEELTADMKARKKRWRQFQKHLSKATGTKFNEILSMNKYSGTVQFDHANQTLDLLVSKDGDCSTQTKDVKALSGGEKSYTTISLLIAMGEHLETPFRVMDEFDVFMDAQARKLTINILIHIAKKLDHRQFIFITPQDLSGLTPDNQLKILKLNPPVRHRTVGGPSQQTINFSQHSASQ